MSTTPNPAGARERDVFMAMLARLDAELDRDLASSKKPVPDAEPQTDFVPTLQLLKEDEMAALAAQPRAPAPRRAPRAARPQRPLIARLLPWLVGGGLAASAASFAVSFTGSRPPSVPAPAAVTAAAPAPVPVAAVAPAPMPAPAAVAPVAPIPEPASPAPVVVAAAPEAKVPAAAADPGTACPPARRALGLCDVQAP